jgi:[ribosomal protein S5]-alanine N-acetyltransferase
VALFRLNRSKSAEPLLRGDGVFLRPGMMEDFAQWAALRGASQSFLVPWEPTWPEDDLTRAAFRRRLRRQAEDSAREESQSFFIFASGADELLGGVTLGGVRRGVAETATLGYWIGARHAGRGHMTRAVAALAIYAFSTMRLHRLEAACIPDNAASIKVLERNGFRREGFARGYLCINGVWRDHLLYARLAGDAVGPAGAVGR